MTEEVRSRQEHDWRGRLAGPSPRWLRLTLVLLAAGCTRFWEPAELPQPATTAEPLEVLGDWQVFTHGKVLEWHAVRVYRDSISGAPRDSSTTCYNCRQALARADIDSIRSWGLSKGERIFWITVLAVGMAQALYYEATGKNLFGLLPPGPPP